MFAWHGIPETIITDNGPQYSSQTFNALVMSIDIGVRDGGSGGQGVAVDPPIRADITFILAKDKTFVRDHSGKTGFDPPNGCWPVRRCL